MLRNAIHMMCAKHEDEAAAATVAASKCITESGDLTDRKIRNGKSRLNSPLGKRDGKFLGIRSPGFFGGRRSDDDHHHRPGSMCVQAQIKQQFFFFDAHGRYGGGGVCKKSACRLSSLSGHVLSH